MRNKSGFTLLELLIAAVIIGTLAVFARQSFKNVSSDIRVQDAQTRAKLVAVGARRYLMDYPAAPASFTSGSINDEDHPMSSSIMNAPSGACNSHKLTLQNLINCGYLEYRQYAKEYRTEKGAKATHFTMYFDFDEGGEVMVCVTRANARKITDTKTYCTDGETVWAKND